MIWLFHTMEEANNFESEHPELEPIAMCPAYITGSVWVLFRAVPKLRIVQPAPYSVYPSGKRRGRPPKIRTAV